MDRLDGLRPACSFRFLRLYLVKFGILMQTQSVEIDTPAGTKLHCQESAQMKRFVRPLLLMAPPFLAL
jgi:hypothetical protein